MSKNSPKFPNGYKKDKVCENCGKPTNKLVFNDYLKKNVCKECDINCKAALDQMMAEEMERDAMYDQLRQSGWDMDYGDSRY